VLPKPQPGVCLADLAGLGGRLVALQAFDLVRLGVSG
jgi:hypothetical protein